MVWQYPIPDRKIEFIIIYCNLKEYDIELVNIFFTKLKNVLHNIAQKTIKQKKININFPIPVYFVSENKENLEPLKNISFNGFSFFYIEAFSLKDAVLRISPILSEEHLKQIENQEEEILIIDNMDVFLYFESISPLLDVEHTESLILDHFTYMAEYTYSDIAVPGFLPIVCNLELAKRIPEPEKEFRWNWSEFLLKNTQTLDLEIYYIEPDYRKYRIRFDLYSKRFQKICKNIVYSNPSTTYKDIEKIFSHQIELIRIAPSYIEVELTTKNELKPIIYPYKKNPSSLPLELFKKLIQDLINYKLEHSFIISFAGTGEPFLYENLKEVLEISIESNLFSKIYLETFFYKIDLEILEYIKLFKENIHIIIKLPTLKEELYKNLMGKNYLPIVKENLKKIPEELTVYAEILRIEQVEEELDDFFEYFKHTKIKPIIGRYNTYGNLLEDFSVVDLEPLEKDYCRSLMFHLFITASGKVPVCRQDIMCKYKEYDLSYYSISQIFSELKNHYNHYINKNYNKIIPLCEKCKDWYVFLG